MSEAEPVQVLRRSPGRLRLHAPALTRDGGAGLARIAATEGVLDVRLNERTGNALIRFDRSLIDEPDVLALITVGPVPRRPAQRARLASVDAQVPVRAGWWRAERGETIHARPAACVAALTDFEHYPEWQTYLTSATVLERDARGRGVRVATRAQVGEREIQFTTSYHFPSPNQIVFEQDDGELEAMHGSWAFRSLGGGRTRATCLVEVKPGWRLSLVLHGPLYEQIREAVLDHVMSELRERVESGRGLARVEPLAPSQSAGETQAVQRR
jgi:ribosome-associated toxin RatA of RatAB toxin-antitoxin module